MSERIINGLKLTDTPTDLCCPACGHTGEFELLEPDQFFGEASFFCPECLLHLMGSGVTVKEYVEGILARL